MGCRHHVPPLRKSCVHTLKSVPNHKTTHFPKCSVTLCIIQRLQVLGAPYLPFVFITAYKKWCACKISIGIVLLGRDFFRLYTCNQRLYLYLRMY